MHTTNVSAILVALAVSPDVLVALSNGNALNIRELQKIYTKPVIKKGPFLPAKSEPEPVPEVKPNPNPKPAPVVKPNPNTIQPSTPTQESSTEFKGYASYYYPNESGGKCVIPYTSYDFVAALEERRFDASLCGKKIHVTMTTGRKVDVTVADLTKGGDNDNWLDLSPAVFRAVARIEDGMIQIT